MITPDSSLQKAEKQLYYIYLFIGYSHFLSPEHYIVIGECVQPHESTRPASAIPPPANKKYANQNDRILLRSNCVSQKQRTGNMNHNREN